VYALPSGIVMAASSFGMPIQVCTYVCTSVCPTTLALLHVLLKLFFTVAFQPSIIISTLQSFERTPMLPPHQQQQQLQKQHVRKTSDSSTPVNTGSKNTKGPTNVEPSSPTTVGESAQQAMDKRHKSTSEEPVVTSKDTEILTHSPPLSPTDVESPSKGSKTLPAKSSAADERKALFAVTKGKSEKKKHSHTTTPEKSETSTTATSPTSTTHPAVVTPEKEKTPTKAATTPSDQQQKTPQDDNTKVTPSSPTSTSTSNTPVKPDPRHAANEDAHTPTANTKASGDHHKDVAESKETEQPLTTPSPGSDEFVIIDLPSPDDLIDSDTAPVEVPVSEYFPVSHVILNSIDWSLTVVNVGLCIMIYSFQPSKPNTTIKVCISAELGSNMLQK